MADINGERQPASASTHVSVFSVASASATMAPVTATLSPKPTSALSPFMPKTALTAKSPLSWKRIGVDVPIAIECTGENGFVYDNSRRQFLNYLRARYYSPTDGQFLSVDPAVDSTLSPYAYVAGNPLNATDPTGMFDWNPIDWGKAATHAALSIVALPVYATYYVSYRTESTLNQAESRLPGGVQPWVDTALAPLHLGLKGLQVAGLKGDVVIDRMKEAIGVPESTCDEGINGHIGPFQTGPVWYLPGVESNGQEQYSWNHPFPWSRGVGSLSRNEAP